MQGVTFRILFRSAFVVLLGVLGMCLPFFGDIVGLVGAIGTQRGRNNLLSSVKSWFVELRVSDQVNTLADLPNYPSSPPSAPGFWPATVYYPIECWIRVYKPSERRKFWLRVGGGGSSPRREVGACPHMDIPLTISQRNPFPPPSFITGAEYRLLCCHPGGNGGQRAAHYS